MPAFVSLLYLPYRYRPLQLQCANLEELLQAPLAKLAADAGVTEAAEGRQRVESTAVNKHLAGAHLTGDFLRLFLVAGEDRTGQTIGCAIGDADGFFLGL